MNITIILPHDSIEAIAKGIKGIIVKPTLPYYFDINRDTVFVMEAQSTAIPLSFKIEMFLIPSVKVDIWSNFGSDMYCSHASLTAFMKRHRTCALWFIGSILHYQKPLDYVRDYASLNQSCLYLHDQFTDSSEFFRDGL